MSQQNWRLCYLFFLQKAQLLSCSGKRYFSFNVLRHCGRHNYTSVIFLITCFSYCTTEFDQIHCWCYIHVFQFTTEFHSEQCILGILRVWFWQPVTPSSNEKMCIFCTLIKFSSAFCNSHLRQQSPHITKHGKRTLMRPIHSTCRTCVKSEITIFPIFKGYESKND